MKLVGKAQKGDKESFAALYSKYKREIFLFYCSRINSREDALDITSECFIKVMKSLHTFKFNSSFRTWLYVIARNLLVDFYKSRKKEISLSQEDLEKFPETETHKNFSSRNSDLLRDVLDKLPENYRTILELRYLMNLKFSECAESMQVTENYAKVLHSRALKKANNYKSVILRSQSK